MIIQKDSENTLIFTLKELTTIQSANYLLELKSKETNQTFYTILGENLSVYSRFDSFVVNEKTSPNALNSEVELKQGQYIYKVYEQASATNLNPTGLNCVEEGRLICKGTTTNNTQYPLATTTFTSYEP